MCLVEKIHIRSSIVKKFPLITIKNKVEMSAKYHTDISCVFGIESVSYGLPTHMDFPIT